MLNISELYDLRTKEELINYFKALGKNLTEEEIENLKKSYEKAQENTSALTIQQLDSVAGGGARFFITHKGKSEFQLDRVELTENDPNFHVELKLQEEDHYTDLEGTNDGKFIAYMVERVAYEYYEIRFSNTRLSHLFEMCKNEVTANKFIEKPYENPEGKIFEEYYEAGIFRGTATNIFKVIFNEVYPELGKFKNFMLKKGIDVGIDSAFRDSFKISDNGGTIIYTNPINKQQYTFEISEKYLPKSPTLLLLEKCLQQGL